MAAIPETLTELTVPVDQLTPYEANPRVGSVDAIAESLGHHGQYRPIVVNRRDNRILAGNHTFAAAQRLGWAEIAVTYVDVDDDQAARIVLVDNRSNDRAGYDDQALADLLRELPDLGGTGWTGEDLEDILAKLEPLDSADLLDDTADGYAEQFGVIVAADDEAEQERIYTDLIEQGYTCKVVTV